MQPRVSGPELTVGYEGSIRLVQVIALIGALTLAGAVMRRLWGFGDRAAQRLNDTVIRFTLPVGIFTAMHNAPLAVGDLAAPAVGWFVTLALLALGWALARALRLERRVAATFVLTATFGNTGFIGYPAVVALFGEEWLPQAVLIDQLGPGALAVTLGAFIAANASAHPDDPFRWQTEVARILRFPPLLALAAGSIWRLGGIPPLPETLTGPMRLVGAATVPLVMVAFGLLIRADELRRALPTAGWVVGLRLFVSPLLALLVCLALGLAPGPTSVVTVQMSVPTMMLTLVLAVRYGLETRLTAAYILATFVVSTVTMPLWSVLLLWLG